MITREIIEQCKSEINTADAIVIGAGAGLSAAGGLLYSGKRFTDNFPEYIERYNLTDMYSSSFYPFATLEEKWAYFSKHIKLNGYDAPVGIVYNQLLDLVQHREYFVISTNADAQFFKAGFDPQKIFAVQGDYRKFQCEVPCHDILYDNESMITQMVEQQHDCHIPSELLPVCPRCGGKLVAHLRIDSRFVENADWHRAQNNYANFISSQGEKRFILLELGIGYNTPGIIRWPFEELVSVRENTRLIRINANNIANRFDIEESSILIQDDIAEFLELLLK